MAKIKGICRNEDCELCDQIQEAEKSNFKCEQCGKDLIPFGNTTKQPKGGNKKLLLALIAAVIVLGGIALLIFSGGGKSRGAVEPMVAVVDSDSIRAVRLAEENRRLQDSLQAVADSLARVADETLIAEEQAKEKVQASPAPKPTASAASGSKDLGYAVFKGTLKNGMPDDVNGRLVFKSSHLIDSRDPKSRVADAGDYVIGEFSEGHLVQGIWYGADNTVKGSIIIGK